MRLVHEASVSSGVISASSNELVHQYRPSSSAYPKSFLRHRTHLASGKSRKAAAGESKMRNLVCKNLLGSSSSKLVEQIDEEGQDGGEKGCGSDVTSSIVSKLAARHWLLPCDQSQSSCSVSCASVQEELKCDFKEDEYCSGSQGQQQPEHQSKSLVLTHGRVMRRIGLLSRVSSSSSLLLSVTLVFTCLVHLSHEQSFFSPSSDEWDGGSFRSGTYGNGYTCVNIPVNFTLCKNIGYTKMMIPNLLGHDSLQEAEFHAKSWVPLLGLQCHPDTQLFLCSLFSPICLDRPIYPCRSLCQGVQAKCEPRMLAYNYPWPSMLKCDQFPEDHDLCIRPGAANKSDGDPEMECPSCNQAHTCENIVDNFCRADFVFRAKYKKSKGTLVEFRKERWFKPRDAMRRGRELRTLSLDSKDDCCATKLRPGFPYIVMGIKRGDEYVVTFAMQWNGKDKILKNAVRTFRSMDCTNPLPMSVTAAGGRNSTNPGAGRRRRRKQGRRRDRQNQNGGCRVSAPGRN